MSWAVVLSVSPKHVLCKSEAGGVCLKGSFPISHRDRNYTKFAVSQRNGMLGRVTFSEFSLSFHLLAKSSPYLLG